jgi:oligosaccharide repeat unit polymerase
MLPVTVLAIGLLAFANYRIGGKAAFYPPVVFCGVWCAALALCWVAGDFFYPLSAESMAIFLCGCVTFSIGSWLAFLIPMRPSAQPAGISKTSNRIITLLVVIVVIAAPLWYRWLVNYSSDSGGTNYLRAVYVVLSEDANQKNGAVSFLLNFVVFADVIALIAFLERDYSKKRAAFAIISTFVLNVMTGGRSGFTMFIFGLICLDWLRTRRIRWKMMIATAAFLFAATSVVAVYVQKGDARPDASIGENLSPVMEVFVTYAAGGPVAFDQLVRDPNIVPVNWSVDRFFLQTLNKFGADFDVPDIKAAFVTVGPHGVNINVYTCYFAYWDTGKPGMMALILFFGFIVAWSYRRAIMGRKTAAIMYSYLFAAILLTIYYEPFFFNINTLLKVYIACWVLYELPLWVPRFSGTMKHAVRANLATTKLSQD